MYNLEGINLEGINLEGINLEGINLECINLEDVMYDLVEYEQYVYKTVTTNYKKGDSRLKFSKHFGYNVYRVFLMSSNSDVTMIKYFKDEKEADDYYKELIKSKEHLNIKYNLGF